MDHNYGHLADSWMGMVCNVRNHYSFSFSSVLKEMAALDHHDLAHAVVLIEVVEVLDRVGPHAQAEGSSAHLSTSLKVPGIDPEVMEAAVVGSAFRWNIRVKTHLSLASLSAVVSIVGGAIGQVVEGHLIISSPSLVNLLEVTQRVFDILLQVSLAKRMLISRQIS